tara:strand:+ start:265 stop:2034 length:1770 start_codon:yes stop_codon:yes gene_type:complete
MKIKNFNSNNIKLLNFLILLFPISFIFGNLFINLEILLICLLGLITYKKDVFYVFSEKNKIFILIVSFFFIVIISTILNNGVSLKNENFLKSIFFLRYLFFLLVLNCMVKNNHLNFKYLLILCLSISFLIALDVNLQFFTGKNILGFESKGIHNSSIFGEELIAGSFIQKFSFLGIFSLPFLFNKSKKMLFLFFISIFAIIGMALMFSGNKMPLLLFLIFITLAIIFVKEMRYHFASAFFLFTLVFISTYNLNKDFKEYYDSLFINLIGFFPTVSNELKTDYSELKINNQNQFYCVFDIYKYSFFDVNKKELTQELFHKYSLQDMHKKKIRSVLEKHFVLMDGDIEKTNCKDPELILNCKNANIDESNCTYSSWNKVLKSNEAKYIFETIATRKVKGENFKRSWFEKLISTKGKEELHSYSYIFEEGKLVIKKYERQKYENYSFGSGHAIIFITAIDTWKDKPLIGGGIKSFRSNCKGKVHLPNRVCENHPHNYYLDVINDTGIIGVILLFLTLYWMFGIKILNNYKKLARMENLVFYALLLTLFIELFPIRTSGSFFSTSSASFIFFLIGLVISVEKFKNLKKNFTEF